MYLAVDVVLHLFRLLEDNDILQASSTCKEWREIGRSDYLWRYRASVPSKYGTKLFTTQLATAPDTWVDLYKNICNFFNPSLFCNVISAALQASSTDYTQVASCSLEDTASFWSSKSSDSPDSNEYVIYSLYEPLSVIKQVNLHFYQENTFRGTYVVFCPKEIQISVGFDINHMHYTSSPMPVKQIRTCQQFVLKEPQFGSVVRIDFLGKTQTHETNNKYYTVLRYIEIRGVPYESFSEDRRTLAESIKTKFSSKMTVIKL